MKAITTTSSPGRSGSRRRRRRAAEQRDALRGTKSPVTRGGSAPAPCAMELGYSVLRQLVPSLPRHQQVSNMDILQHVIDYILDLQDALDTSSGHMQETEQSTAELLKGTEADEGGTLLR